MTFIFLTSYFGTDIISNSRPAVRIQNHQFLRSVSKTQVLCFNPFYWILISQLTFLTPEWNIFLSVSKYEEEMYISKQGVVKSAEYWKFSFKARKLSFFNNSNLCLPRWASQLQWEVKKPETACLPQEASSS